MRGSGSMLLSVLVAWLLPARSDAGLGSPTTRILFGSCNKPELEQPLWPHILARRPDVWIWGGDNVYADTPKDRTLFSPAFVPTTAEHVRDLYAQEMSNEGYAQLLLSPTRVVGTWDDHDFGINDGDGGFPNKAGTQQAFLDFIGEDADSERRRQRGVYTAEHFEFGHRDRSVLVVLLDMRYNKDPYGTEDGDFLGEDQWRWLEQTLARSKARVHLILSSIQFHQLRGLDIGESWGRFPSAKARMLRTLAASNASAPILLSGDVHFAELSGAKCNAAQQLLEVTSSGMTHSWGQMPFAEPLRALAQRVLPWRYQLRDPETGAPQYYLGLNFGELEFDWPRQQVAVTIFGEGGRPQVRQLFPLGGLGAGAGAAAEGPACLPEGGEPPAWRTTAGAGVMIALLSLGLVAACACVACPCVLLAVVACRRGCKDGGGSESEESGGSEESSDGSVLLDG